uniref:Uncharacterized protein n=1 Tax=Fagus sylvatica TaxID=28930 RepID=A0A2N9EQA8_FAGSY
MKKKKSEIASPMVKKFSHQRHTKEDLGLKFEDLSDGIPGVGLGFEFEDLGLGLEDVGFNGQWIWVSEFGFW